MPCSDPYVKVTFAPASGVEPIKGEKTATIKKVCYTAEQDVQLDTIWIMFGCRHALLRPRPAFRHCSTVLHANNGMLGIGMGIRSLMPYLVIDLFIRLAFHCCHISVPDSETEVG